MANSLDVHAIRSGLPEVQAEVMQVIRVKATRGCGVTFCKEPHEHQILRQVVQYFSLDGAFLAEHDTWPTGVSILSEV